MRIPRVLSGQRAFGSGDRRTIRHGTGSLKVSFLHFSHSEAEIALMRAIRQAMGP